LRLAGCVDGLGAAPFFPYLISLVTSGEIGRKAGAEGATAPETLRQTDPRDIDASGKRHVGFDPDASADGIILSGTATDGAFSDFARESPLDRSARAL
jgi:hypothetical protein